jgi:hypothetical protein
MLHFYHFITYKLIFEGEKPGWRWENRRDNRKKVDQRQKKSLGYIRRLKG